MDVLRNATDNFTLTRVSGPPCDQMTGLEKRNHQLLFAVCDGELLRHVNHKRPSVGGVNPAGLRHPNYRSRVSERSHVIDSIPNVHPFVMSCWVDDCIGGLKNALLCSLLMSLCVWGGAWGGGGRNGNEVCELKPLRKEVRPRKASNYERKSVVSLLVYELQTYSCTWHARTHVCSTHYPLLKPGNTKLPFVSVSA